jgi:hypothetical protein
MPTKRSKPDDKDTLNGTDYMKLRIIFSEHALMYAEHGPQGEHGPIADLEYNPREYTAHIQIVSDDEKSNNMNTRQMLDHVMDEAELFVNSRLYEKLVAEGYYHYCYHPSEENYTQQWTLITLID